MTLIALRTQLATQLAGITGIKGVDAYPLQTAPLAADLPRIVVDEQAPFCRAAIAGVDTVHITYGFVCKYLHAPLGLGALPDRDQAGAAVFQSVLERIFASLALAGASAGLEGPVFGEWGIVAVGSGKYAGFELKVSYAEEIEVAVGY